MKVSIMVIGIIIERVFIYGTRRGFRVDQVNTKLHYIWIMMKREKSKFIVICLILLYNHYQLISLSLSLNSFL